MKEDYRQQWILTQWQQYELDREVAHLRGMLQALGLGSWSVTKTGHLEVGAGSLTLLEAFDVGLVFGKQMYRVKQANWTDKPIGQHHKEDADINKSLAAPEKGQGD